MEESFPLRQMQKIRTSLGEAEAEAEAEVVVVERESRDSIVSRAQAALQRVAELVARDPEVAAMAEEIRRQRAAASE